MGLIQLLRGGSGGDRAACPFGVHGAKGVCAHHRLSAEMNAALLRRRNALRLPLLDELPLGLGDVSQKLQHNVPIKRLFDTITFCTRKGQFCTLLGAPLIDSAPKA